MRWRAHWTFSNPDPWPVTPLFVKCLLLLPKKCTEECRLVRSQHKQIDCAENRKFLVLSMGTDGRLHVSASSERETVTSLHNSRMDWCCGNTVQFCFCRYRVRIPDEHRLSWLVLTGRPRTKSGIVRQLRRDRLLPNPFRLIVNYSSCHATQSSFSTVTDHGSCHGMSRRIQALCGMTMQCLETW
jgi:hypothetical protein